MIHQLIVEDAKMQAIADEMKATHGVTAATNAVLMMKQFRRMMYKAIIDGRPHFMFGLSDNAVFDKILENWSINNQIVLTKNQFGHYSWRLREDSDG